MRTPTISLLAALGFATSGCYGLDAGSSYPDYPSKEVEPHLLSPELESDPSISLNRVIIRDELCEGLDPSTETRQLAQDDLSRFLDKAGIPQVEVKARGNLFWFDFPGEDPDDGDVVRLRLAILADAKQAADELHRSLLEHGPGWWGLRRSNLSILAPKASLSVALAFVVKHKLACWGMMSYTGLDDVYVVPGPYMEL
jgi:hypothetical protein